MKAKVANPRKKVKTKSPSGRSEIQIVRAPLFQKTYGTRALVTRTEYDFRVVLANEKMLSDSGEEFLVGESLVILTPLAAKELCTQLDRLIKDWEKAYGSIKKRSADSLYSEQSLPE